MRIGIGQHGGQPRGFVARESCARACGRMPAPRPPRHRCRGRTRRCSGRPRGCAAWATATRCSTVNQASRPLRTQLRPFHRNRFLATCCEMVLAPRARPAALAPRPGLLDLLEVEAAVLGEALVFGSHHRQWQLRGDLRRSRATALQLPGARIVIEPGGDARIDDERRGPGIDEAQQRAPPAPTAAAPPARCQQATQRRSSLRASGCWVPPASRGR